MSTGLKVLLQYSEQLVAGGAGEQALGARLRLYHYKPHAKTQVVIFNRIVIAIPCACGFAP